MTPTVPNQWPTKLAARRIACIGEAPGGSELRWHRCPACKRGWDPGKTYSYKCPDCATAGVPSPEPFVGPSGWLLNQLLAEVGIDRAACFVGNVCIEENTPVLMADLTWKALKDVEVGDWLLAFDECGKTRGPQLRRWRFSQVTAKQTSKKACWKLFTVHGDLTLTQDHKVLSMPDNRCSSSRWSRVDSLWIGRSNLATAFPHQFCNSYSQFDLGYLAGLFDGEGTLTVSSAPKAKRNIRAAFFNTNKGIMFRGVKALIDMKFQIDVDHIKKRDEHHKDGWRVGIKGGVGATIRFLSVVSPQRLIDRFHVIMDDPPVFRPRPSKVYARDVKVGLQTVVDIQTTTGTFIANGFAVHNCQFNPPGNDITHFKWDGPEVQGGLVQLWADLAVFKPHFCLLLGGSALRAFKGHKCSIEAFRGSLFCATLDGGVTKEAVATEVEPPAGEEGNLALQVSNPASPIISPPDCGDLCLDAHPPEGGHAPGQAALWDSSSVAERHAESLGGTNDGSAAASQLAPSPEPRIGVKVMGFDSLSVPPISSAVPVLAASQAVGQTALQPVVAGCERVECEGRGEALLDSSTTLEPCAQREELRTSAAVLPFQVKCLATYHPAALQRDYSLTAVVRFDVAKAAREARTDELVLPTREIEIGLPKQELLARLAELRSRKLLTALDIEGGCGNIACIGFATSAASAFVVPFANVDGTSVWDESDEVELWEAVAGVLEDPAVPKVIMNALYELFVLAWTLGIVIRGLQDDIMLGHWELYCELEKSLEFQASIYTNQPYWKLHHKKVRGRYLPFHPDGRLATSEEWYTYNGIDCCVTFECAEVIAARLAKAPGSLRHYRFNMQLLMPILYMQLRGIRYDKEAAKAKLRWVERWIGVLQDMLNRAAAHARPELNTVYQVCESCSGEAGEAMVALIRTHLCLAKPRRKREVTTTRTFKNGKTKTTTKVVSEPVEIRTLEDCVEFAKESCKDDVRRICRLLERGCRHGGDRSALAEALNVHVKVNSTGNGGDACWFLYEVCGFEKQYQKEGNRKTDRLASDDEACIKIWVQEQKKPQAWQHGGVKVKNRGRLALAFMKLRRLLTQTETLSADIDADGRIRCGYNVLKSTGKGGLTKTARIACSESPNGTGYNLQTVSKPFRDLFQADPGKEMGQEDLAGADGWTVAAYSAMLGDRTMLEDYKAKLKPAQIGVLMWQRGPAVNKLSREELKPLCKAITEESTKWEYFAFKRVQHMSSYKGGHETMSNQILADSVKKSLDKGGSGEPVFVPPRVCEQIQRTCFFTRYWGILKWHDWTAQQLRQYGQLTASIGFTRRFFGRKEDHATLKDALAHLPQVYTTHSTMMALLKMWSDPENRHADGSLECEPLHTVHDSLVDQYPADKREWAVAKHKEWFNNPVLIASEMLVIPFEMMAGPDWKHVEPV